MKNNKGFTLIELLAVIVVLAVIALIAVPVVLNIIESARKGAAVSSARSYIKAVETYTVSSELDKSKIVLSKNNKYSVTKTTSIENKTYQAINDLVDIKGTKPNGNKDYVTLEDNYQVDEAKLTINGYEIFLKNDNVIGITKNGNIIKESLLSDLVNVGDYVAYDAGVWTSSAGLPTSQGEFGGYTAGQNKSNSVSTCNTYGSTSLKGWRVFKIDKTTNTVTIIHAGQPECYYHDTNVTDSITALNNRAVSMYLDSDLADSAHIMNYSDALNITGNIRATDNTLRKIGSLYWLATSGNEFFSLARPNSLCDVRADDGGMGAAPSRSNGIRPVVVLKPNIKTTGKTTDKVGQEAWGLVAP